MLKVTTKSGLGKKSHRHVVWYNEETGEYFCAEAGPKDGKHIHEIMPDGIGGFVIVPAPDGHTHDDIEEYEKDYGFKKEKDEDIISDIKSLYVEACEIEEKSFEKGDEAEHFYVGNQWKEASRSYLESRDRACITHNLIGKQIDLLRGIQTQQRTDITYLPQEDSDHVTADLFNIVSKHILNRCDFDVEESLAFEDQVIAGRANYNVYVSFDDSLEGDIKVEKFDWRDVRYGPHLKLDLSDCEYQIKEKVFSKAKVMQLWPDKAEEINADYQNYLTFSDYSRNASAVYEGRSDLSPFMPVSLAGKPMVDIARKEYKVLECWRKVYINKTILVHESGYQFDAEGWKKADIEAALTIPGFVDLKRTCTKFRITRTAGSVILSDEYPAELPVDSFFTIPVYAYKKGNEFWGKVEWAKDPQREVNKRHSQAIDVVNKSANYNQFIDATTFPNSKEKNKFLQNSSSPGAVFEVVNTGKIPVATQGVKVPSEIIQLIELGDTGVGKMMGVEVEFAGANEPTGRWLQRQKQRMAGNETIFDRLSYAKRQIGRLLIPMIQKYWSADRIFRLLQSQNVMPDEMIAGVPATDFGIEDIETALSADVNLDVVVAESDSSPSTKFAQYMLLTELAQGGQVAIPPQILIELLPEASKTLKNKLLDALDQQMQAESAAAEATAQGEISKSLIGKGIIPPDVQAMLQEQGGEAMPMEGEQQFVEDASGAFPTPQDVSAPAPGEKVYHVTQLPDGSQEVRLKSSGA